MKLIVIFLMSMFLISFASAITVSHGADMTGEVSDDIIPRRGINITSLNNINLTILGKPAYTNATTCYLYDADSNFMASGGFIGDICTLAGNKTLIRQRQYQILMDRNGSSYSLNGSISILPVYSEGINWNQGCYNGGCNVSQNGQVFGFNNLTYTIISNPFYEGLQGFESIVYEMAPATYTANISSTSNTITSARLVYAGSTYTGTVTNTGALNYTLSVTVPAIPIGVTTNSFHWNVTLNDSTTKTTYSKTQASNQTILTSCNATYTTKYLNFSFKDETTLSFINATIGSSSFTYWIGDASVNKTYLYSNTTANWNYTFCASPIDRTYNILYSMSVSSSGYPQRNIISAASSYTNATSSQIIYLLSSLEGIYVTFQIKNSADQVLEGVYVTANTSISSVSTRIGQGYSDAAGTITFWVNPNNEHTFIFSKSGYDPITYTTFPTQTSYTITLGSGATATEFDYSQGISYTIRPVDGFINKSQSYIFNFSLSTSYWSLDKFGFILRNSTGIIASDSSTSSSGGVTSVTINTENNSIIYMEYYYVIGGNYTNMTRSWLVYNLTGSEFSLANFFKDFKSYVGVGDGIFGLKKDSLSLNIVIFVFILLTTGMISYGFGFNSPAPVLAILWSLVAFFDIGLGLIWNPPLAELAGISNFPTIFIGLITMAIVIKEVSS